MFSKAMAAERRTPENAKNADRKQESVLSSSRAQRMDYLREVIHFHDGDTSAAILALYYRGVGAGRQCRDNR